MSFISIVMGHPVICCQSPPSGKLLVFSVDMIRDKWFLNFSFLFSSEMLSFSTAGLLLPFLSFPTLPLLHPGIAFLSVLSPWTSLIWAVLSHLPGALNLITQFCWLLGPQRKTSFLMRKHILKCCY